MAFVVIVFSFALQWFFNISSDPYQREWAPHYLAWLRKYFSGLMQGHGLFTLLICVLPILIVVSLLLTLLYHLFGHVGYLILSLMLFWYCIDITALRVSSRRAFSAEQFLIESYQKIFSPLFWYLVFGPIGLTLSVVITILEKEFLSESAFSLAVQVIDWLPVRALGLSFALVGNFGSVFKLWIKHLPRGLSDEQSEVLTLAQEALGGGADNKSLLLSDVVNLLHRTILVWLIVIALVLISGWLS